ncbi:MAG: TolC family protein, partial [Calditrichaeota bacterium]
TAEDSSTGELSTQKLKISNDNEFSFTTTLDQAIYSFGKVGSAITASGHYKKLVNYNFTSQRQEVLTQVKKSFYGTILLKNVYEVSKESEENAKENYEKIKTRFENGASSEFALLQAEVNWQNAIPQTLKVKEDYELALNNLKSQVGISLEEEVKLTGSFEKYPTLPTKLALDAVLEQRPDYNSLLWKKKFDDKVTSIQFANHLPSLTGNLTYSYSAQSDKFKLDNDNDNVILGLNLNIPIFSGGLTDSKVQQAKIDAKKTETQIAMTTDFIEIELKNIYIKLQKSEQRINATKKGVSTAERAFKIAESSVKNGLATQLELKESRNALNFAKVNYYTAVYEYLEAYFDWQKAIGNVN